MGATAENGIAMAQGDKQMPPEINDGQGPPVADQTLTEANRSHNPLDPEAFYSSEHHKERQERQSRRKQLKEFRRPIVQLPLNHQWEIPGRPNVVFSIRDYAQPSQLEGRKLAREELPFLFKAFEMGQKPPPRPGTKRAEVPRAATIHEYLDWTVTASEPDDPDELDFGGFRVLVLMPRYKMTWPPPSRPYNTEKPLKHPGLGAPLPPIPHVQVHNKPICAATVRLGPGWLEVPFYATHESRRNRGNGRALLEAIEDICRMLKVPRILLCSTDDTKVKNTWLRLGFQFTNKEDLDAMGVTRHDLLHMDNTVQMHKDVPERPPWRPLLLKHDAFVQRLYYMPGGGTAPPVPEKVMNLTADMVASNRRLIFPAKKPSKPSKKRRR